MNGIVKNEERLGKRLEDEKLFYKAGGGPPQFHWTVSHTFPWHEEVKVGLETPKGALM